MMKHELGPAAGGGNTPNAGARGNMMGRRGTLGVLAGGAAALLSGCGLLGGNRGRLRYRITLEIDTPSGLKTGSSVLEYEYPSKTGLSYGQAPFVDLGNGRYVFALIDQMSGPWGVFRYPDLQPPIPRDDVPWSEFDRANELKPKAVLKLADYPKLVTFGDINHPTTVREVSPSAVKRITFQVVDSDEPLTTGFEEKFKWAVDGDTTLSGDRYGKVGDKQMLAEQLYANNFVRRKK